VSFAVATSNELPLKEAIHSTNGDILQNLLYLDGQYGELDSSAIITLKFSAPVTLPGPGDVRDYVLETNGRYVLPSLRDNLSKKGENQVPLRNKLYDNCPNPFNPTTTIKYDLARASNVKITIYNILGQEVRVLVNELKKAGSYNVKFDGTNLSSGIYFCRIEAGSFIDAKKMVLVR